ncbi:outer membrane protein assembly factor BamE [Terrihabitans sp. B22-R8]|uniref:outer membrane protein assembly factor BamE n=1 Tax=Terrihabitans sp. B22-R8 TaxID=3425128 RepID=UPI00403CE12E
MFESGCGRRLAVSALVLGCALTLGACSAVSTTQTRGYMISESALDQIPVGSSQEQVQIVLGTPSTTATIDGEVFYYISSTEKRTMRFMKPQTVDQRVLAVYFDKDRRVARVANYGLQDGKVFDFISRKTPTSGVEKNFVSQLLGLLQF